MARVKYTRRPDDSGWLGVLLRDTASLGFLCEYTAVEITQELADRTFFRVADGASAHVGKIASLRKQNAATFLSDVGPGGPASVRVKYGARSEEVSPYKGKLDQQWGAADFSKTHAQVTLNSDWTGKFTPLPPGNHKIMAPDQSHANISTTGYRQAVPGLRCTDVWFPIQLEGIPGNSSRYIHAGHMSDGCVTVHELIKWNAVYDYLIACRSPGTSGQFVGTLIVEGGDIRALKGD
jgi:hypothetical protein